MSKDKEVEQLRSEIEGPQDAQDPSGSDANSTDGEAEREASYLRLEKDPEQDQPTTEPPAPPVAQVVFANRESLRFSLKLHRLPVELASVYSTLIAISLQEALRSGEIEIERTSQDLDDFQPMVEFSFDKVDSCAFEVKFLDFREDLVERQIGIAARFLLDQTTWDRFNQFNARLEEAIGRQAIVDQFMNKGGQPGPGSPDFRRMRR